MSSGSGEQWVVPGNGPSLGQSEVHVWLVNLDQTDEIVCQLRATLSSEEYSRANQFAFEHLRRRFIVCHGVLRQILGAYLAAEPQTLSFEVGQFGKPRLADDFAAHCMHFNLSHSCGRAVYAVAKGRRLGIDIESVRPLDRIGELAETCFSADELAALRSLPEEQRQRAFFDGWTRKEAFLKATGCGLSVSLETFSVSLTPGRGIQGLKVHDQSESGTPWTLISLPSASDFAAAVVIEGADCSVKCARWIVNNSSDCYTQQTEDVRGCDVHGYTLASGPNGALQRRSEVN